VTNGFSGLLNRFIGLWPGRSTNTCNTWKGYWNNNTKSSTLPRLDAPCKNSVRSVHSLLSSLLSCPRTGLLLLGKTFQYLISSLLSSSSESESYVTTDGQSASLSWNKELFGGLTTRSDSCGFVDLGRPFWREDGSVVYNCCWPSPSQSFSGSSLVGLVAIFYYLRFETSLFVASNDSQGHGGGIRPRLHTGIVVKYHHLDPASKAVHS
jgi:hypothetical protein